MRRYEHKNFLLQHNCIQLGVVCKTWEDAIYCAAQPLIDAKFITEKYPIAVIKTRRNMVLIMFLMKASRFHMLALNAGCGRIVSVY